MKRAVVAALLAACVVGLPAGAQAQTRAPRPHLAPVEGEVIVQFKAGASVLRQHAMAARAEAATVSQVLADRAAALGARQGRTLQAGHAVGERMQVVRASGVAAHVLAAQLAADPEVEFAVPNGRRRALTAPNDPLYPATAVGVRPTGPDSGQWYLRAPTASVVSAIDIETAWLRTTGSASVVVAVLDTGVRPEHPDLAGRLLPGYDFVSDAVVGNDGDGRDADPTDPGDWVTAAEARTTRFAGCSAQNSSWHGTSTSSLVGASTNDGVGMAGTAPGVKLLPVRVLGKCYGTDADIWAGMLWAVGIHVDGVPDNPNPARVLNMSLGGCTTTNGVSDCSCDAGYQAIVNQVLAKGAVIVSAAGNSNGGPVEPPGTCSGVIPVAAIRHVGTKVGFSSLGPEVAISAPGGNCVNTTAGSPCLYPVLSATNTGTTGPVGSSWFDSYTFEYGTSFSAPLVAGVAALMVSVQPTLTPAQVRSKLQSSARAFPTSGDSGATAQCTAPVTGTDQLQCYCTTTTCGAGMLDAGAAVAAVAGPVAKVDVSTASPTAGSPVTVSAASSVVASGTSIASYAWTVADGGGIVSAFSSATNAASATLTPSAAGSFTVRLTITDNLGASASATQTVAVAAAPVATPPPAATGNGGGGGGGASSPLWLAALAVAVWAVSRAGRRD